MIGKAFRLRNWRHYADAKNWAEFAHPDKKLVGVFLLLGFENKDGSGPQINIDERLKELGWTPPADAAPTAKSDA